MLYQNWIYKTDSKVIWNPGVDGLYVRCYYKTRFSSLCPATSLDQCDTSSTTETKTSSETTDMMLMHTSPRHHYHDAPKHFNPDDNNNNNDDDDAAAVQLTSSPVEEVVSFTYEELNKCDGEPEPDRVT